MQNKDTFLKNPQYRFDVTKVYMKQNNTCEFRDRVRITPTLSQDGEEVVIQLSQKERRQFPEDSWLNRIGVHVMRVEDNRVFLLHRNQEIVGRTLYQPVRPTRG